MATHSSILVWRYPWTEESGRRQSMESQRIGESYIRYFVVVVVLNTQIPFLIFFQYFGSGPFSRCVFLEVKSPEIPRFLLL